ncbi:hypothetical protein JW859_14285 [bacterium]|nr:hypothetical protein [bacterium]
MRWGKDRWAALALMLVAVIISFNQSSCANGGNLSSAPEVAAAPADSVLTERLASALAALGKDSASVDLQPVSGDFSGATWVEAVYSGPPAPERAESLTITWLELLPGDYNQDGLVDASDLTPLGQHWGQQVEYDAADLHNGNSWFPAGDPTGDGSLNWRLARIDGNRDGLIGLADITTIAQHWRECIHGYLISDQPITDSWPGEEGFCLDYSRNSLLASEANQPVLLSKKFDIMYLGNLGLSLQTSDAVFNDRVDLEDATTAFPLTIYIKPYLWLNNEYINTHPLAATQSIVLESPARSVSTWFDSPRFDGLHAQVAAGPLALGEGAVLAIEFCVQPNALDDHELSVLCWIDDHGRVNRLLELPAELQDASLCLGQDGTVVWCGRALDGDDAPTAEAILTFTATGELLAAKRCMLPADLTGEFTESPQLITDGAGQLITVSTIAVEESGWQYLLIRDFDVEFDNFNQHAYNLAVPTYFPDLYYYGAYSPRGAFDTEGNLVVAGNAQGGMLDESMYIACFGSEFEPLWNRVVHPWTANSGTNDGVPVIDLDILPDGRRLMLCDAADSSFFNLAVITADGQLDGFWETDGIAVGEINSITTDYDNSLGVGYIMLNDWPTASVPALMEISIDEMSASLFALLDSADHSYGELFSIDIGESTVWSFGAAWDSVYWESVNEIALVPIDINVDVYEEFELIERTLGVSPFKSEDYLPAIEDLTGGVTINSDASGLMLMRMRY